MSWNSRRTILRKIKALEDEDYKGDVVDSQTNTRINSLNSDISTFRNTINDQNTTISNIITLSNTISSQFTNINNSVNSIQTNLTDAITASNNLKVRTDTLETTTTNLQTATTNLQTDTVNLNSSKLSIVDYNIDQLTIQTANDSSISNANSRIDSLSTDNNTLSTRVSSLESKTYAPITDPSFSGKIILNTNNVIQASDNNLNFGSDNSITTGTRNIIFGNLSCPAITTGSQNVAVGYGSLRQNNGSRNTMIGDEAGRDLITGSQNTCIGSGANVNTTSNNSTAIGYGATSTASNEIILGNSAVLNVKTSGKIYTSGVVVNNSTNANEILLANGLTNTTIKTDVNTLKTDVNTLKTDVNTLKTASNAGALPKTGGTMSGDIDMDYNRILNGSVIYTGQIFADSLITKTGSQNQFVKGDGSLDNTTYLTSSQAVGKYVSLTGSTMTGNLTLPTLTTDNKNISVGGMIVGYTDTASIYMGYNAGGGSAHHPSITGTSNICFGQNVGSQLTTGSKNIGIGDGTLYNITTQTSNTSVGDFAGITNVGNNNTYLGAGSGGTSGSDNVAIGHNSTCSTFSNCVAIGKSATNTASNQIVLGNTNITELKTNARNLVVNDGAFPLSIRSSASKNVIIGQGCGSNTTIIDNTPDLINIGSNTILTGGDMSIHICSSNFAGNNAPQGLTVSNNVVVGHYSAGFKDSSDENVVIGNQTGVNIGYGSKNIFIGNMANYDFVNAQIDYTTNESIAIGYHALSLHNNSTAIGSESKTTQSNQIILGNTNITECVLGGVGNTTSLYKGGGFLKNGGLATQQLRANGTTKITNVCWTPNGTLGSSTGTVTMASAVYFMVQECPYSMTTSSIVLYRSATTSSNIGCGIYNSSNVRLASALSGSTTSTTFTIPIVCDLVGGQYYYICFYCPGGVIYGNSSTGVATTNNDLITGYTAKYFSISGTSVPLTITGTATLTTVMMPYFKINGTL